MFGMCIVTDVDGGQSVSLTWTGVLSASGQDLGPGMKLEPRGKDVKIATIAATGTPLSRRMGGFLGR
jgi:hypothetical protein